MSARQDIRKDTPSVGAPLLDNLQVCRAFAAITVVTGHALHDAGVVAARRGIEFPGSGIDWTFGVDVFFVISGFIMVYVSGKDFAKRGSAWTFLRRRLIRIVPLYWALTTIMLIVGLLLPQLLAIPVGSFQYVASSYLFIPEWRVGAPVPEIRPLLALGWTLNYEMLFYVALAGVMFLPVRRAIAVLTLLFAAAVTARFTLDIQQTQLMFWSDPIILEFLMGCYLALARQAGWRLPTPAALVLAAAGIAGLLANSGGAAELRPLMVGLPALLLVAAAALGPTLPKLAPTRFAILLGDASYALYLSHPLVIRTLREVWLKFADPAWPLWLYALLCVAAASLAAIPIYLLFERPVTRLLQGKAQGKSEAPKDFGAGSGQAATASAGR
ncbi:acyltransferase [Bosea sp. LjRoot90]|uniref:acyltransferase family protein n=1 Tax=Bosea sp. LjRoot90 TaxID=3342342 RepID=UPI003ECD10C3